MKRGLTRLQGGAVQGMTGPSGQTAQDYGRNVEPLPDIYLFSVLTEQDAAYADELSGRRARLETLARDITELGGRLAADVSEDGSASQASRRGRFLRRRAGQA